MSQLIILSIDKERKSSTYLAFPIKTVPLDNQTVDEGKFFFTEVSQLINEERIMELEYHHFANLMK